MDSKINRKRLSHFLSYEWILTIVFCIVAIIVWELVYSIASVKLSVGQQFKIHYDSSVYGNYAEFVKELQDNDTFSFDVINLGSETIIEDTDVLSTRFSVQDVDILFTEDVQPNEDAKNKTVRAKSRVDAMEIYDYRVLFSDAKEYLQGFLKDGLNKTEELELDYQNLDEQKIEDGFYDRLGKDNRFRSSEQKAEGIKLEKQRIKKLCEETKAFKKIVELPDEYFFIYTKYAQSLEFAETNYEKEETQKRYDYEISKGRENCRYGLRVDKLKLQTSENKKDPTAFVQLSNVTGEKATAENVILMVFNVRKHQPELQFETICAVNTLVRACSTILD